MNKQKTRYTRGMPKAYKMPIDEFCMCYGLDIKVIMHRLNITCWQDFDALVVPTALWDTKPHIIKRALKMLNMGWSHKEIANRLGIPDEHVAIIENLSEYEKEIYLDVEGKYFKTYFHLNSDAIDVSRIFHAVDPDSMIVSA